MQVGCKKYILSKNEIPNLFINRQKRLIHPSSLIRTVQLKESEAFGLSERKGISTTSFWGNAAFYWLTDLYKLVRSTSS